MHGEFLIDTIKCAKTSDVDIQINLTDEYYVNGVDVNGSDMGGVVMHYLPRDYERNFGVSMDYKL